MKTIQRIFVLGIVLAIAASAQCISLTGMGTAYTQDFSTLAITGTSSTLPAGWALAESGTNANTTYTAGTGSGNAGDTYSFGAAASTERAFGGLQSGSLIPTIGACFKNDTGSAIGSLAIAYTGEQWRLGTAGRVDRLDFQYSTNATSLTTGAWTDHNPLDFNGPISSGTTGALNGNAAANRTAISASITGLSLANGASIWIRWTDFNASGADDGLAVDDFSLTPSADPGLPQSCTPTHVISQVQGSGPKSPVSGAVTVQGIITALKYNGFFIQSRSADQDADPNTSEGVFVFTSSNPGVAAVIGNLVCVAGTVAEYPSGATLPSLTELSGSPSYFVVSTNNPLPAPVALNAGMTPTGSTDLNLLEKYEGMRVSIASLDVTSPTDGSVVETAATSTSNGLFYGVMTGVARPFREPGIQNPNVIPPLGDVPANGQPCCVTVFDGNPERLRVDSGSAPIEVAMGAVVTNLTGVLDYAPGVYSVVVDPAVPPTVTPGPAAATPIPAATAAEVTVAGFNLERFFNDVDDPGIGEPVLTTTAFNNRLNKASLAIRNVLGTPDILGVIELENLATLQSLAAKLNADAVAASQPNPGYTAYLVEGRDIGGIDVGFLVKSARVSAIDVVQFGYDATFINPNTSAAETLHDRPPLRLRATVNGPGGVSMPLTVVVNHLLSLTNVEGTGTTSIRARAKRKAQADFLANLIQGWQSANPSELIIAVGDFNSFEFNDGYVDTMGIIKGSPAPAGSAVLTGSDLVNPDLTNLIDNLGPAVRYSYNFDGNAQNLDEYLVNAPALARVNRFAVARVDSDWPDSLRNDPNRPERISDHDALVGYFSLPNGTDVTSSTKVTGTGLLYSRITGTFNGTITITNTGAAPLAAPVQLLFPTLTAGITLANRTGTFVGQPYITALTTGALNPGQSVKVAVRFSNPSNLGISYTTKVIQGGL